MAQVQKQHWVFHEQCAYYYCKIVLMGTSHARIFFYPCVHYQLDLQNNPLLPMKYMGYGFSMTRR